MTYWGVNAVFLGMAAVVLLTTALVRRPPARFWGALAASTVLLVVLTAVFDNVMIASGIMTYTDRNISGVRIGLAPLEDFAYPVAGVLLLPTMWLLLGGTPGAAAGDGRATAASSSSAVAAATAAGAGDENASGEDADTDGTSTGRAHAGGRPSGNPADGRDEPC